MKKPRNKYFESTKALLIAFFAALVLRQFVLASYNVPTGSMKDTILIGDFMFVNKFAYGARTPTWIGLPYFKEGSIGFRLPYVTFPSILDPQQYDIVVFEYPLKLYQDYIKRCVAVEGQKIEMKNQILYVDGKPEGTTNVGNAEMDLVEQAWVRYVDVLSPTGKEYAIRLRVNREPAKDSIKYVRFTDETLQKLRKMKQPAHFVSALQEVVSDTFSWREPVRERVEKIAYKSFPYDPKQFSRVREDRREAAWRYMVLTHMQTAVDSAEYLLADSLVVPDNHYFMMGDNRDNSLDGRSWGFVDRELVVGKPLMIWLSWSDQPNVGLGSKIRWERLGKVVK